MLPNWFIQKQKWHIKTSKTKNLYREDAKFAKKQQASPDFLSYFALLRLCGENAFILLRFFTAEKQQASPDFLSSFALFPSLR